MDTLFDNATGEGLDHHDQIRADMLMDPVGMLIGSAKRCQLMSTTDGKTDYMAVKAGLKKIWPTRIPPSDTQSTVGMGSGSKTSIARTAALWYVGTTVL